MGQTSLSDLKLCELLQIRYPIIMAPMFLVSNVRMVEEAVKAGITGAIPALNYRTDAEFRQALTRLRDGGTRPFGINLIVNKSNIRLREQLQSCLDFEVDYIITSLGSPEMVIRACQGTQTKVFCDVVDANFAAKVEQLGAHALIAVNREAGGHAGNLSPEELLPLLKKQCRIPVISAGGVGSRAQMQRFIDLGADGFSIGSIFIASPEAEVSEEYKNAIVQYGADDIVMTTKLSGTPCTVINTPYVKEIGTEQNRLERLLNKNRRLKKWAKMLTFYKGMKKLRKAAFSATYKTLWCAGPSIEHVHAIRPIREIVEELVKN